MMIVSPHEEAMPVGGAMMYREPGRTSADVANVRGAVKSVAAAAASTVPAAMAVAAAPREGFRCERQAAERENCGQRNDCLACHLPAPPFLRAPSMQNVGPAK
jgi:hypothetical protein